MPDSQKPAVATTTAPAPAVGTAATAPIPPKRSPGHRGADVKDTVAEMAGRAQEISLEAGSKKAAPMKDGIGAAAGLTGLVLESARDLLQYMVRRGQMTQEEADKLMREVEASHAKRKPSSPPPAAPLPSRAPMPAAAPATNHAPPVRHTPAQAAAPVRHAAPKPHEPAKKPTAKKPTMKPAAKKHPVKAAAKPKPKASGKTAKRR